MVAALAAACVGGVDGERGMQWIADRFNGLPSTPNCGQF